MRFRNIDKKYLAILKAINNGSLREEFVEEILDDVLSYAVFKEEVNEVLGNNKGDK